MDCVYLVQRQQVTDTHFYRIMPRESREKVAMHSMPAGTAAYCYVYRQHVLHVRGVLVLCVRCAGVCEWKALLDALSALSK